MDSKCWFTMKDVLNDLAQVTGRRIQKFDTKYIVSGEAPPPAGLVEEDDDFLQMHDDIICKDSTTVDPDLAGIQQMLRMVNDESTCYDENENIEQLQKNVDSVVTISKLNPSVPAFVPKREKAIKSDISSSSSESSSEKTICKNANDESCTNDNNLNNAHRNNIDVNKKNDLTNLNSEDLKDVREKLKLKIKNTSKTDCLKKKRERNLAIAILLRSYADKPSPPKNDLKLISPDYFKTPPKHEEDEECKNGQHIEEVETKSDDKKVDDVKLVPHDYVHVLPEPSPTKALQEDNGDAFENASEDLTQTNNCVALNDMKESVKKVENWLQKPEKQKQKASIYLGPVTFKKKASPCVSPSVDTSEKYLKTTSENFVPSSYADELAHSYMKQSKAKEALSDNIWTKLERELKEKDKAILDKSQKN